MTLVSAFRRAAAIFTIATAAGACSTYSTMEARTQLLQETAKFYAPQSGGPAPLVVLMSGCGGHFGADGQPNTIMETYAKVAAEAGAYAVIVDSFDPRGITYKERISTVCTGLQLRGDARAGDALAAEALARSHWNVAFTGIILSGWSHGAWTVMELLSVDPDAKRVGNLNVEGPIGALHPAAATLFYPYCGFLNSSGRKPWAFHGPVLFAGPELDSMGSIDACRKVLQGGRPGLAGVQTVVFPGMTHAFDEESQAEGSSFIYDAAEAARASGIYAKFIAEQVDRLK